jgi:exopolyphosphatase/guanosine-5'-triphosphate,3'-diphosphate pyrophosphatase
VPSQASKSIGGAIDVGSNSVHLLAARIKRSRRKSALGTLVALEDRSDLIGLGDAIQDNGLIPPEALQATVDSVHAMCDSAAETGATDIVVMGTEPLRRATNADEMIAAVERYLGLTMHVLTERQEAALTYLGVTAGRPSEEALAVIDIGGGSTEVALSLPEMPLAVVAVATGSARLTNAIVHNDPPTWPELDELVAAARDAVAEAVWPDLQAGSVERAVFVGGTATNIARMGRLDRRHIEEDLSTLAKMPAEEVISHYDVRPRRAMQLAAGVAIVRAVLEQLNLPEAEVSEASLRDGAILVRAACGDEWLERLDSLTGGSPPRG